jgi:hypothetical protein
MKISRLIFLASIIAIVSANVVGQDTDQTKQADKVIADNSNAAQKAVAKIETKSAPTTTNEALNGKQPAAQSKAAPFMSHAEWVTASLTLIYVIATSFYVIISFHTLRAIKRQADIADFAANASLLNAKAFIKSQMPQIIATANGNPTKTLEDREAPRVEISLINRGVTPAHNLIYETWTEILPMPFTDFTSSADYFKFSDPIVLYPDHKSFVINIPLRNGLSDQQLSDLKHLRFFLCLRIRVQYVDAFESKGRYADFGFIILGNGLGFLPKYNDAG